VRSLVTLHGTNEGSLAVYAVGLSPWSMRPIPFSILWWIFTFIYFIVWWDDDALNRASGLCLRHWKAQRRKTRQDTTGISLARLLWWRPGGDDNAGRDLTPARMRECNSTFLQTLPCRDTRYIAVFGVAFAPDTVQTPEGRVLRYGGLHLPCRDVWTRFPFVVFLLPLGAIQACYGMLSRFAFHARTIWVEAAHDPANAAPRPPHMPGKGLVPVLQLDKVLNAAPGHARKRAAWSGGVIECDEGHSGRRKSSRMAALGSWASRWRVRLANVVSRVIWAKSTGSLWYDDEASDGILSVSAQKAPASECIRASPREYASIASFSDAVQAEGSAAVPEGVWTQVFLGFHDHIAVTQDDASGWQRDTLRTLCSVLISLQASAVGS
jgi:hypothetical protein